MELKPTPVVLVAWLIRLLVGTGLVLLGMVQDSMALIAVGGLVMFSSEILIVAREIRDRVRGWRTQS